jgi:hypothetical protein
MKKIILIVNKDVTISDFIQITGLKESNFWFQYIIRLFCLRATVCNNYVDLVKFLEMQFAVDYVIRQLNAFDINGDTFVNKHTFILDQSDFDLDFSKLSSRKFKVIMFE